MDFRALFSVNYKKGQFFFPHNSGSLSVGSRKDSLTVLEKAK